MEYVHNELVESLNTENMSYVTLKALEWIEDVGVVTERILHAILACFASPYGSVRGKEWDCKLKVAKYRNIDQKYKSSKNPKFDQKN